MSNYNSRSIVRAAAPICDVLERRVLFSTINWTNKGNLSSDTDGFNAQYGANAFIARTNVQRAVDDWARAIVNFNYAGGGNTFNVEIRAAPIGGRGLTQNITHNAGKPNSADIVLDDNGGGLGWYFDNLVGSATTPDDGEFQTILNLFTADNPNLGNDLYRTALHELAHAMGISQTSGLLINNFLTNVAADPNDPSSRIFAFNVGGGAVEGTFTNDGGLHSFEGPSVLGLPAHPNDLINSGRTIGTGINRRQLISDFILTTLQQAYGYTVLAANQRNTFAVNFNDATNLVTINGDLNPNGSDGDNISVTPSGSLSTRYFVNGRFEDVGNLQHTAVQINARDAGDTVNIDVMTRIATVSGGSGDDVLVLAGTSSNLDNIVETVVFSGDAGTDRVLFEDEGSANAFAYTINRTGSTSMTFTRPNSGLVTMFNTEIHSINGAGGANIFNINATQPNAEWTLNGFNGNDVFNIGVVGGNAEAVDGPVIINGMVGTDTFNYNDTTATGSPTYTLTNTQLTRTGNGTVTYATVESVKVDAGAGDNSITYNSTAFEPIPVALNGNGGNDTIQFDPTSAISGMIPANILDVVGGAGTDTFTINDSPSVVGLNLAQITNNNLNTLSSGNIDYSTLESVVWNCLSNQNKAFVIGSTAASTSLTINGGSGNEAFNVGGFGFSGSLDQILGPITVNGNGGADFLRFNDQDTLFAHTYTLNGNSFFRTGSATTTFATVEDVVINTGDGADTIEIVDQPAGVTVTIDGGVGLDAVNVNSDGVGTATLTFSTTQDLAALNIGAGGTVQLAAGGFVVLETDSLSIAPTGKLDLADNSMIVDYSGASPANSIRSRLTTGYNGGLWTGNGINSSSAAATAGRGVGSAEASNLFTTFPATFAGRPVDSTAVLVRHTRYGDADLSSAVDIGDFARLAASFNRTGTGWTTGNFNYDNTTDIGDFSSLAANFNQSASPRVPPRGPNSPFSTKTIGLFNDSVLPLLE